MSITFIRSRFTLIAVAVLAGLSLATVDASAACASMPCAGECRTACCKATRSASPVRAAASVIMGERLSTQEGNVCQETPGCNCRPTAPSAPKPAERRAAEGGPDAGRHVESAWLDFGVVYRPFISQIPPTVSPSGQSPLYLRNARLLI